MFIALRVKFVRPGFIAQQNALACNHFADAGQLGFRELFLPAVREPDGILRSLQKLVG